MQHNSENEDGGQATVLLSPPNGHTQNENLAETWADRPVIVVPEILPTLGSGTPELRALGLRLLLGFLKLGWLKMLVASNRSWSLACSHRGRPQLLAREKSKSVNLGPRSEFLGLLPNEFTGGAA